MLASASSRSTSGRRTDTFGFVFRLPPLPYAYEALEPWISRETVRLHHEKHQAGYLNNLNAILDEPEVRRALDGHATDQAGLEALIMNLDPDGGDDESMAYRNASQAWNHEFYWRSMSPRGGTPSLTRAINLGRMPNIAFFRGKRQSAERTSLDVKAAIMRSAGTIAKAVYPAPWIWITLDDDGDLALKLIDGFDTPLVHGVRPLAVCDGWEHAYYLDHPADRTAYMRVWVEYLLNWDTVAGNIESFSA